MTDGYVYCFSNPMYVGIYKVGFTINNPHVRRKQLNTTGVPLPFKLEFSKKVSNYQEKEKTLHKLLTQYGERINLKREFFKISLEEIRTFFDLMDGEWFRDEKPTDDEEEEEEDVGIREVLTDRIPAKSKLKKDAEI